MVNRHTSKLEMVWTNIQNKQKQTFAESTYRMWIEMKREFYLLLFNQIKEVESDWGMYLG